MYFVRTLASAWIACCLAHFSMAEFAMAQVGLDAFPKLDADTDWPWWRGVTRDGHALSSAPVELDESRNLDWAQPIPGRGHGSPIVVGNRLFLLSADEQQKVHWAIALDRQTGEQLWQVEINRGGFPAKNHPKNTEASPTMACDGERLFMGLYHLDSIMVTALSLEGDKLWETRLGRYRPTLYEYGYAASPVMYGELVIFSYEFDGPSALVALRRSDGQEVWRTPRPGTITFSSPVVTSHDGQDYLLMSGFDYIRAYDPATGQQLWQTEGTTTATCGTMIWDQGIAFASGGFPKSETIALDLKTGHVLWRNRQRSYEQSLVASKGYVYSYADSGVLYCWDGRTGREMWKQRLGDHVSASGVLADGKIYWANEAGELWVFRADPSRYVQLAKNKLGDEAFASPAIAAGQLFLRVAKHERGRRQEYVMRFSGR